MEGWEKAKVLSSMIAAVFLPVVLLLVGNNYSGAIKERELQGRFVEIAVDILKQQPTEETHNLREWATQVVSRYSGIELSAETKKDLIEKTPLPSERYENRLGNSQPGDGAKFIGRGYAMLTGRGNYEHFGQVIGIDLASAPDRAAEPEIAAQIIVAFVLDRKDRINAALTSGNLAAAGRTMNGGMAGLERISILWKAYRAALDTGGTLPEADNANPEWSTIHVPALVAAMEKGGIAEEKLRAYILAVADYETQQGRTMTELDQ